MTSKTRERIGPWRVNRQAVAFDNPWISIVDHEVVHPDDTVGPYGVVRFKNIAIGVLPITEDGHVWLVGQHRFPLDHYSWELPEGGGPVDAPPLRSAQRELAEETGLTAASWSELCRFDVSNSVTDERAIGYLAWDLTSDEAQPESSEKLTVRQVLFKDLFAMVLDGEITDGLTIVMTLAAHAKALRGEAPAPISRHILAATART